MEKSIAPFKGSEQTSNAPSTLADAPLISPAPSTSADAPLISPAPSSSFEESTSYWPHLPIVRSRDSYPHDLKHDRQTCRKIGKPHSTLFPGSVTLHCQHGRSVHFYFKYLNLLCKTNAESVKLEESFEQTKDKKTLHLFVNEYMKDSIFSLRIPAPSWLDSSVGRALYR